MDRAAFNSAILSSPLCACSEDELRHMTSTELFDVSDATLRRIADDHAPASTTVQRIRPLSRWFDGDCRMSRRKTRQLRRRYRRSFDDADRAAWIAQVKSMHTLFQQKENSYWTTCIASNAGNQKKLWRSLSSILQRDKDSSTPTPLLTAEKLSQFFIDNINAVRADTENSDPPTFTVAYTPGSSLRPSRSTRRRTSKNFCCVTAKDLFA